MVAGEKDGKRREGVWDGLTHTAIFKMAKQQGPTMYSTRSSAQCFWQPGWEGSLWENMYMYS